MIPSINNLPQKQESRRKWVSPQLRVLYIIVTIYAAGIFVLFRQYDPTLALYGTILTLFIYCPLFYLLFRGKDRARKWSLIVMGAYFTFDKLSSSYVIGGKLDIGVLLIWLLGIVPITQALVLEMNWGKRVAFPSAKTIAWRIYFGILVVIVLQATIFTGFPRLWEWIDLIFTAIGLVGLFGYSWDKRIATPNMWSIFLPAWVVWNLLYNYLIPWPPTVVAQIGERTMLTTTLSMIFIIPLLIVLYRYSHPVSKKAVPEITI